MDMKKIGEFLSALRHERGLTQEQLGLALGVTNKTVSRWENGDTTPNIDTLKLLSKLFDVSINTLLGSPRQLICQCCGMPLEDSVISRETDGQYNEDYCKWCYSDGKYAYSDLNTLIDFCAKHMADKDHFEEQIRGYLSETLPKLDHWKRYAEIGGKENLDRFKTNVIEEINALAKSVGHRHIVEWCRLRGNCSGRVKEHPHKLTFTYLRRTQLYRTTDPSEYSMTILSSEKPHFR